MKPDVLRLLDANLNRAREALRVIEDYARFVRDDATIVAATKAARHALRLPESVATDAQLLDARQVESDVGRAVKLESELARGSTEAVVAASFARLGESLRVINEYAKLFDATFAVSAERARYEFYALAPRLLLRGEATARLRASGVYVIVSESLCARPWQETVEAILAAGVQIVQLREKSLPDAEVLRRLRWMREITAKHGAMLVANDRPDLARLSNADAIHIGQDDVSVADARRIAGNTPLVGVSTHTLEQARAAAAAMPDYLAVGPIYASHTKPQPHVAGLTTLRAVRAETALPLVAIGGIDASNAAEVFAGGADVVCVCSAVISAGNAAIAAAQLLEIGNRARSVV